MTVFPISFSTKPNRIIFMRFTNLPPIKEEEYNNLLPI